MNTHAIQAEIERVRGGPGNRFIRGPLISAALHCRLLEFALRSGIKGDANDSPESIAMSLAAARYFQVSDISEGQEPPRD